MTNIIGTVVGEYFVVGKLGGSSGILYDARHRLDARRAVLKAYADAVGEVDAFAEEAAKLLRSVTAPRVVAIPGGERFLIAEGQ